MHVDTTTGPEGLLIRLPIQKTQAAFMRRGSYFEQQLAKTRTKENEKSWQRPDGGNVRAMLRVDVYAMVMMVMHRVLTANRLH